MYRDITFADRNPIKRWLQQQRLTSAIRVSGHELRDAQNVCDYGAGNGELCKQLIAQAPRASVHCFEPTPALRREAQENLRGLPNVQVCESAEQLPRESMDLAFCLEVLEHLPAAETEQALTNLASILKPHGLLVLGVPVEVGPAALYKGLFRMARRRGDFDATWANVWRSAMGRPPASRPRREIAPGMTYFPHHTGFDYRALRARLRASPDWTLHGATFSPFPLPGAVMPEAYFLLRKRPAP